MDPATCERHAQICGVLTPHLVGARILEHETPDMSASCYLPTWKVVMAQLVEQGQVPRPERCGPWGRQDCGPAYYNDDELIYVVKRLRNSLAKDIKMTYEKVNAGAFSDNYLKAASFLDHDSRHCFS